MSDHATMTQNLRTRLGRKRAERATIVDSIKRGYRTELHLVGTGP